MKTSDVFLTKQAEKAEHTQVEITKQQSKAVFSDKEKALVDILMHWIHIQTM